MKRETALAAIAFAVTLLGSGPASASTRFGNDCLANASEPAYTMLQLGRASGAALPLTAPSDGVISEWGVGIDPSFVVEAEPLRLLVFRASGNPNEFQSVGESANQAVGQGGFRAGTRISVEAGDRLGLFGPTGQGTPACDTGAPADQLGILAGDTALGSVHAFYAVPGFQLAATATLEPDADGDGYGDETQDGCPKSASHHIGCPTIRFEVSEYWARRRSIVVRVITDSAARIRLKGRVAWAAGHDRAPRRRVVVLPERGKDASPGRVLAFRVRLPAPVLQRLRRLPPRRALRAKLVLATTDLADRVVDERLTVRLKGRAAPVGSRPVATLPE